MQIDENLLKRRLAGLKLASIFLGAISMLTLIFGIIFPPYSINYLNQIYTLASLALGAYFAFVFFHLIKTIMNILHGVQL